VTGLLFTARHKALLENIKKTLVCHLLLISQGWGQIAQSNSSDDLLTLDWRNIRKLRSIDGFSASTIIDLN